MEDFAIYNVCVFKISFYSFDYHSQSAGYLWVREHYHIKDRRQKNIQTSRQKSKPEVLGYIDSSPENEAWRE